MNKELTVQLYQSINARHKPREIHHWHCSSLAKCPRALYLERKKVAGLPHNEPAGGKKLRWDGGHALEAAIREDVMTIWPSAYTNARFLNKKLDMTGEVDAYDPATKTLISVKSVQERAFVQIEGEFGLKQDSGMRKPSPRTGNPIIVWEHRTEPYIHHEWQEHGYIHLFNHPDTECVEAEGGAEDLQVTKKEVEYITYIYITLGGLIATFTTKVKPEILKRVDGKIGYLNTCWKGGILPLCLCQEGQEMYQVQDQYCPYKTEAGCCDESLIKEGKNVR